MHFWQGLFFTSFEMNKYHSPPHKVIDVIVIKINTLTKDNLPIQINLVQKDVSMRRLRNQECHLASFKLFARNELISHSAIFSPVWMVKKVVYFRNLFCKTCDISWNSSFESSFWRNCKRNLFISFDFLSFLGFAWPQDQIWAFIFFWTWQPYS